MLRTAVRADYNGTELIGTILLNQNCLRFDLNICAFRPFSSVLSSSYRIYVHSRRSGEQGNGSCAKVWLVGEQKQDYHRILDLNLCTVPATTDSSFLCAMYIHTRM